ncbi:S8 family serine peptidase [Streptomyces dysideae]|uniref:S8 family serine peptidase n=1 Tax=Streptomyces dysideae TaxID=909626 RepID=UPI000830164D|nr:S8 family serine peptidase [Streptomyces dysideae]
MSQHHPGRRQRVGRRTVSLLAPALVGGLILTSGPPAMAAPAGPTQNSPADGNRQTYTGGTYFVQLADKPVATYSKTAPEPGERLNPRSRAVRDYLDHLKQQRDKVLDAVEGVAPLYSYQYVLNGFAAELTAGEANKLARTPGVVSLVRNKMRQVTATADTDTAAAAGPRTAATEATAGSLPVPDTAKFLGLKDRDGLYSKFPGGEKRAGEGLIVGVLDTGIDTNNPSLQALSSTPDADVIAKKWKGSCDVGQDIEHRVTCNNKVIGAQWFRKGIAEPGPTDWASPMDAEAHGTHTATTAAGNIDVPATVPDSGISGRISGIAPASRIAAYKVCWSPGCATVDLVAGIDRAVADGVDVINYSLGGPAQSTTEPEDVAMFNAAKAGVFVSASSGNAGPNTASNTIPWVTTVAASTHDVGYRTTVTLGNGKAYTGVGISASAVPSAPLIDGAKAAKSGVDATKAAQCQADALDPDKVKGAIVVCARGVNARIDKSAQVKAAGGVGMVLYNVSSADEEVADAHTIPSTHLDQASGEAVKAYADRTGATAELGAAQGVKQAGSMIAGFSSGGPDPLSGGDLLKPDITAPGVDVVAGTTPGGEGGAFKGDQGIMSGTSMSAPHVAGLALLIKGLHPDWSPMEVKSALMTTATTKDSAGDAIRRSGSDSPATPLDYGAGHVVPNSADDPGLVYNSTSADWTSYSCALDDHLANADGSDACATAPKTDPSDLNYPTISVGDLAGKQTVTRTVTNVGDKTGVYTAKLQTPAGYKAVVTPRTLTVAPGESATYKVSFTRTSAAFGEWSYGSVLLSDQDGHRVRSAVALRATPIITAADATGKDATGSVTLHPRTGYDGKLTTAVNGLYTGTTKTGTLTGTNRAFDPSASPLPAATVKTEITVPEGTTFARVGIRSADHLAGSDLDLWVLDKDGNQVSELPGDGSDEHVDLEPGTYEVYVNQFALPSGATSQPYTLHTWLIGPGSKPDHAATATPAEQRATLGGTPKVTVSWQNLPTGHTYLGLVGYGNGTDTFGSTALTVTPWPCARRASRHRTCPVAARRLSGVGRIPGPRTRSMRAGRGANAGNQNAP